MPYKSKEQQKEYWRSYYEKNKDKVTQYKKDWQQKNPHKAVEYAAKQNARYKAHPDKYSTYFRNRYIFKTYGLTAEQYEQMFAAQGGVCGICGGVPDAERHGFSRLAVDHCHKTQRIRGLLCNPCNAGMGLIGDTIEHLLKAVEYLKKQKQ